MYVFWRDMFFKNSPYITFTWYINQFFHLNIFSLFPQTCFTHELNVSPFELLTLISLVMFGLVDRLIKLRREEKLQFSEEE